MEDLAKPEAKRDNLSFLNNTSQPTTIKHLGLGKYFVYTHRRKFATADLKKSQYKTKKVKSGAFRYGQCSGNSDCNFSGNFAKL